MGEQLVISISREFGSGGHEIAAKLAERLDLVFYDRSMLDEIAAGMNADAAELCNNLFIRISMIANSS